MSEKLEKLAAEREAKIEALKDEIAKIEKRPLSERMDWPDGIVVDKVKA